MRMPTNKQMLDTHCKLSILVSSRLIQFINATDKCQKALIPLLKKDLPSDVVKSLNEAIEALKDTNLAVF